MKVKSNLQESRKYSDFLKSFAHPVRIQILTCLMENDTTVSDLVKYCKVPQPAVSLFLKRMKTEGLVKSEKTGTSVTYSLSDPRTVALMKFLKQTVRR